ncbi:hypothetical protein PAXRUDRAFT_827451, partial [Paxillus rubicundulus Ve08.2h10]
MSPFQGWMDEADFSPPALLTVSSFPPVPGFDENFSQDTGTVLPQSNGVAAIVT